MTTKSDGISVLSVHRNMLDKRERRLIRSHLKRAVHRLGTSPDIAGFALITWNKAWDSESAWRCDVALPSTVMPEFIKVALLREMTNQDIEEAMHPESFPDEEA